MEENQQRREADLEGPETVATVAAEIPAEAKVNLPAGRFLSLVLDLAVGFGALVVLGMLVVILQQIGQQIILPLTCGVFFAAAATKAVWSKLNPWIEGLAIALGAFFPVAVLAVAVGHAGRLEVWGFALLATVGSGAGAQAQKLWQARQPLAGVAIAVGLLAVVFAGGKLAGPMLMSMGSQTMHEPAPPFTLTMLDGTPVTRDSLKGRVVVMDFWGTWCEPCMAEMPTILKLHRRFASDPQVAFLAVNALWHEDNPDVVRSFVLRKHMDVPVALDTQKVTRTLKVDGLPTLIVIDRKGIIRTENVGYSVNEPLERELTREIQGLLAEPGQ